MNMMTLTQIATRLRVLSQTLDRPITNLTMALKAAAPNQPTMHHQYRRNGREFNANYNYYYFITNKTENTFKHWIQKCLGSFENKRIIRINIYGLVVNAFSNFCSSSVLVGAYFSVDYHYNTTYVNVGRYIARIPSPRVAASTWLAQFPQVLLIKLVALLLM